MKISEHLSNDIFYNNNAIAIDFNDFIGVLRRASQAQTQFNTLNNLYQDLRNSVARSLDAGKKPTKIKRILTQLEMVLWRLQDLAKTYEMRMAEVNSLATKIVGKVNPDGMPENQSGLEAYLSLCTNIEAEKREKYQGKEILRRFDLVTGSHDSATQLHQNQAPIMTFQQGLSIDQLTIRNWLTSAGLPVKQQDAVSNIEARIRVLTAARQALQVQLTQLQSMADQPADVISKRLKPLSEALKKYTASVVTLTSQYHDYRQLTRDKGFADTRLVSAIDDALYRSQDVQTAVEKVIDASSDQRQAAVNNALALSALQGDLTPPAPKQPRERTRSMLGRVEGNAAANLDTPSDDKPKKRARSLSSIPSQLNTSFEDILRQSRKPKAAASTDAVTTAANSSNISQLQRRGRSISAPTTAATPGTLNEDLPTYRRKRSLSDSVVHAASKAANQASAAITDTAHNMVTKNPNLVKDTPIVFITKSVFTIAREAAKFLTPLVNQAMTALGMSDELPAQKRTLDHHPEKDSQNLVDLKAKDAEIRQRNQTQVVIQPTIHAAETFLTTAREVIEKCKDPAVRQNLTPAQKQTYLERANQLVSTLETDHTVHVKLMSSREFDSMPDDLDTIQLALRKELNDYVPDVTPTLHH